MMYLSPARSLVQGVKQQIRVILAGTVLLILVLLASVSVWDKVHQQASEKIHAIATSRRMELLAEVSEELANGLIPLHRSVTRLAAHAAAAREVWLPPRAGFYEHSLENVDRIKQWLDVELHEHRHRQCDATGDCGAYTIHDVGVVVPLKADLESPASTWAECVHVATFEVFYRFHELEFAHQQVVTDAGTGDKAVSRVVHRRNGTVAKPAGKPAGKPAAKPSGGPAATPSGAPAPASTPSSAPAPESSPSGTPASSPGSATSCELAISTYVNGSRDPAFGNWTWLFPELPWLRGTTPFRRCSDCGGGGIGQVYAVQDAKGLSEALATFKSPDRPWLENGHILLMTASGRVLAQTELKDSFETVFDLPASLTLRAATTELVAQLGILCPHRPEHLSTGTAVIDVAPFDAHRYGLPRLDWCVVMTLPRVSIYGVVEEAELTAYLFLLGVTFMGGGCVAFLWLALLSSWRVKQGLEMDKFRKDMMKVNESVKEARELSCPMALISAPDFLALQKLEDHESLRDKHQLLVLDSIDGWQGILMFQEKNTIVFISHQWLGCDFPDVADGTKLCVMQEATGSLMHSRHLSPNAVFIWVDYISIPQCHSKLRSAAVGSRPVYASLADVFLIVAPTLAHADGGVLRDLETYKRQGWCRAEMLSKACASGLTNIFVTTGRGGEVWALSDLSTFSLNVFEGEFSVKADQEILVKPMLGLYALVLDDPDSNHMKEIHAHILADKEAFFPRTYRDGKGEEVELFGQCIELLETAAQQSRALWRTESSDALHNTAIAE